MAFWNALMTVCHNVDSTVKVATTTVKHLTTGKVGSWEHRVLYFNALASLAQIGNPDVSEKALEGYFSMVAKETNEQAMAAAIDGVGRHLIVLIYNDEYSDSHKDFINKAVKTSSDGLKSAKTAARKSWALAFGNTVWAHEKPSQTLESNIVPYLQNLFATFDKIVDKPLLWKDGPLEAYILIGALSGRIQQWPAIPEAVTAMLTKHKYPSSLLVSSPKPSFLLWDRIYTKALSPAEGLWFVRALTSVFSRESQASLEKTGAGYLCAQALIWTLSSHPDHTVRKAAYENVAAIAKSDAVKLGNFVKQALKQWLLDVSEKIADHARVCVH